MTKRSGRFAIIPARAIDDRRLGNAALTVLACLGTYADRSGWCWPSLATLARRLDLTRQTIAHHVKDLEVRRRKRDNRINHVNEYRLLFDGDIDAVFDRLADVNLTAEGCSSGSSTCSSDTNRGVRVALTQTSQENVNVRHAHLEQFQCFWRTYPSRHPHSNPRKTAQEKFAAALKRGVAPADVIRGAENFAEHVKRQGGDPKFIPMASTWLSQERWADFQEVPPEPEPPEVAPL